MKTILVLSIIFWEYLVITNSIDLKEIGNVVVKPYICVDNCITPHVDINYENNTLQQVEFRRGKFSIKSIEKYIVEAAQKKKENGNILENTIKKKLTLVAKNSKKSFNKFMKMSDKELLDETKILLKINDVKWELGKRIKEIAMTTTEEIANLIPKADQDIKELADRYAISVKDYIVGNEKHIQTKVQVAEFVTNIHKLIGTANAALMGLYNCHKNNINSLVKMGSSTLIDSAKFYISRFNDIMKESKDVDTERYIINISEIYRQLAKRTGDKLESNTQNCLALFYVQVKGSIEMVNKVLLAVEDLKKNPCSIKTLIKIIIDIIDKRKKANKTIHLEFIGRLTGETTGFSHSVDIDVENGNKCKIQSPTCTLKN